METPSAVLRKCTHRGEAETIRIRLAAAGIPAFITGTMLFPPILTLYSIFLLTHLHIDAYRDQNFRRRIIIAWCINLAVIPISLIWWHMMIFT